MRLLWEILTLAFAVLLLMAIARGFPQFGKVLGFLLLNPIGLICGIALVGCLVAIRRRRGQRKLQRGAGNRPFP